MRMKIIVPQLKTRWISTALIQFSGFMIHVELVVRVLLLRIALVRPHPL